MPEQTPNPADTEIILAEGDLRVRVSPWGASLRGMWRKAASGHKTDIVTGYEGGKNKLGGQGDVLIPFPGRVKGGKYTFNGETYQMPLADKDGPNAIHGFLRGVLWETVENEAASATFAVSLDGETNAGYPFALRATVAYELSGTLGLTCRFVVENTGTQTAPVGAGFHPYFTVSDGLINDDHLHLPFAAILEMENLIPTGRIVPIGGTPMDFHMSRVIGVTVFNTCYARPTPDGDGKTRIRLSSPVTNRTVTVWMDAAAFPFVVLYSGDPLPDSHKRRSLAIEPMTCGADAFNHPDWGLASLAPGETLSGAWGVI